MNVSRAVLAVAMVVAPVASAAPQWKLTTIEQLEKPKLRNDAEYAYDFACNQTACTTTASFRKQTFLRAKNSWTMPPAILAPGAVIPVTYTAEVIEARPGPGGFRSQSFARLSFNGAPTTGYDETEVGNATPPKAQKTNKELKLPATGKKGDKVAFQVFVFTGWAQAMFSYTYEWSD